MLIELFKDPLLFFLLGNLAKHSIHHVKNQAADIESINPDGNRQKVISSNG